MIGNAPAFRFAAGGRIAKFKSPRNVMFKPLSIQKNFCAFSELAVAQNHLPNAGAQKRKQIFRR